MSFDSGSYLQSDRDLAVRLVSTLLGPHVPAFGLNYQIRREGPVPIPMEVRPDIYWDDILDDVQKYREQTSFCEKRGFPVLCIDPLIGGGRPTPVLLGL